MTQKRINEILSLDNVKIMILIAELKANEDLVNVMNHFFVVKDTWPLIGYNTHGIPELFKTNKQGKIVPNRKLRKYEMDALKAVLYNKNKYWKMFMELKEGLK